MTPQEFITWFKGFVAAAHNYNITPAQWDQVKDQLGKVQDGPVTKAYWQTTTTAGNPAENKVAYFTNDDKRLLND